MSDAIHQRIDEIVKSAPVMLFMKGSKSFPQCGFSATVVQILKSVVPDFETFNVLSDADIRQGVKDYANWPTIPQLYINGEFVGGCDIIRDMHASGDLHKTLGVEIKEVAPPELTITDAAAEQFRAALGDAGDNEGVHLSVDAMFQPDLGIGAKGAADIALIANGIQVFVPQASVERVTGTTIDYQETPQGGGFKLDNPNAPSEIVQLSPEELKSKLDSGEVTELYDVRTPAERDTAKLAGAVHLDDAAMSHIESLPKDTPIAFHCHHGRRSQTALEHFRDKGFKKLYNLAGGIEAWSLKIDSDIPRY